MAAPQPSVSPPQADSKPPISIQSPSKTITPTHFQHRTTNAAAVNTFIDTSTPALNSTPIELDSTPVSPVTRSAGSWKDFSSSSSAAALSQGGGADQQQQLGGIGKALAKSGLGSKILTSKIADKLQGGAGEGGSLRADDPAIMRAPPGTPGAEDFEVVEQRDGGKITKEMD